MKGRVYLTAVVGSSLAASIFAVTASVADGTAPRQATEKPPADVTVIGMGGTIAGKADSRVDFETYEPGHFAVEKLVGDLQPEIGEIADVSTAEFGQRHRETTHWSTTRSSPRWWTSACGPKTPW